MEVLTNDGESALYRGVYEVELETGAPAANPCLDTDVSVQFERPDRSTVSVDGFYDGGGVFRARAYCDAIGTWRWKAKADDPDLIDSGTFEVTPSNCLGKLRQHPGDPRRLEYDDDEWFLHVGDTGYRYPVGTEPDWQEYLDGAVRAGATKIRTWFARARHGGEALFADDDCESGELDLIYWQELDRWARGR